MWSKTVCETPALDEGRDDQGRHPDAVPAEGRSVVLGRELPGVDVVEEAAVLVVDDDEERFLPERRGGERSEEREHELLAGHHRRGRMVVVGARRAEETEVDEVRVDPRDRRERSLAGIVEEGPALEQGLAAEVRELLVVEEAIAAVDRAERPGIVRVPAPGDVVPIEVAHERLQVVDGNLPVRALASRAAGDRVEAIRPGRPGDGAEPPVAHLELAGEVVVDRDVGAGQVGEDERLVERAVGRQRIVLEFRSNALT